MARETKDFNWRVVPSPDGKYKNENARLSVLMDIRDELKLVTDQLQQLNGYIGCRNCLEIPAILRRIDGNTKKKPRKKAEKVGKI